MLICPLHPAKLAKPIQLGSATYENRVEIHEALRTTDNWKTIRKVLNEVAKIDIRVLQPF